jgi:AcrR family transcriptional regulator
MTEATTSLRERKKIRARALIQEQALRLFSTHGYEQTTVAQIAEAAEVSPSTLFRYFATKADIVQYDMLDPILFAAYREQPANLSPIGALRHAARETMKAAPPQLMAQQWERARIILSIPELRASVLDDTSQVESLFADAETARTGHRPGPFEVHILAGALAGAITAVLRSGPTEAGGDYAAALDRALALLESGLPL